MAVFVSTWPDTLNTTNALPISSRSPRRGTIWMKSFNVRWRFWDRCPRKIGTGPSSFSFFLSPQKQQRQIKGPVPLEPSHYFRFRQGHTACTRRRVYLPKASIAVPKPTPYYYSSGARLPLYSFLLLPLQHYEVELGYENCEPSEI